MKINIIRLLNLLKVQNLIVSQENKVQIVDGLTLQPEKNLQHEAIHGEEVSKTKHLWCREVSREK